MLACLLNSRTTRANELPAALKAVSVPASNFFCTDRLGAEKIAVSFRENADCHAQIAKDNPGTSTLIFVGIAGLALGLLAGFVAK
jgi:hypothetical protein